MADETISFNSGRRKAEAMGRFVELHALQNDLIEKLNNLLQP